MDIPVVSARTLDSGLGAGGGDGAHGSDHEVGEEQVRVGGALVEVVTEVRDLGGLGLALEGTRVGAGGGIVELCGRRERTSGIQTGRRPRHSACQSTRGNSEGRHCG